MKTFDRRTAWAVAAAVMATVIFIVAGGHTRLHAQPSRGKFVYDAHCVECHGASGKGDGPAASHLTPAPRDFTSGKYKIRSTESGNVPADDDLLQTVRRGLYGTAMPAWDKLLPDADLREVVGYIKTLSPRFSGDTPKPVALGTPVAGSLDSVTRGRQAYEKLQCGKCHGSDGQGAGAVATDFQDDWQQPLHASNLTEPWTFHGGATARDIYMRFRTGMSGTPMPSFADAATSNEMWDLANYVVSLARKPVWAMTADEVNAFYARLDADEKANPVKRGAQLVETLNCALCHSPVDDQKRILPGMRLAGGLRFRIEPYGDFVTGNLTSDKATGLGTWTDDEIKRMVTKGIRRDGMRLLPYPMDWASFSTLKPQDLNAVVAYLRTLPPVSNKVPPPQWRFLPLQLWGKFKFLILGDDPPLVIFTGNAGVKEGA
jgi:mono/diheme cytochrome c family protein